MRELSLSELPCIAGGIGLDNNVISLVGMVSALASYEFSTNVMQTLGFSDGRTNIGTSAAAVGGRTLALSLWSNPNYPPGDRMCIGIILSVLCGVSVGVASELINAAHAGIIENH